MDHEKRCCIKLLEAELRHGEEHFLDQSPTPVRIPKGWRREIGVWELLEEE
jgi:hypothetical protein